MTKAENERYRKLRRAVMAAIDDYMQDDWGHKSYEGTFEVLVGYPNYFEDEKGEQGPNYYRITLHCYVLGPSRHYDWDGETFGEALKKAEKEIYSWIGEVAEDEG